ncbi:alkaline phosphatase D family protein [Porticoccus sp. W117]|uniref:alkaline phosphatase D family protein n=1 Tax=Porticoccus sp. W117 TaxID=3054777 RepID=UPI002595B138|nr:alkaline phosphatase D family protein [Porticoccus sp. W117]MDM3870475.1 alkaline phosphatase D family protein [Porticoccus sp. W117]
MTFSLSRRHFLRAATTSGVVLGGWSSQVLAALVEPVRNQLFSHGVASGDPTHNSVVIWTRVSAQGDTPVSWELFKDKAMQQSIQRGSAITNASRDHTVKIDVQNLQPGNTYYYRFHCNGVSSEPGRTRTLPSGSLDKLTLAIASCSNYSFGYFNGYEVIAADPDVDFVLHLGDYIYEYGGENAWSAETGRQLGREHVPPHEIVTLEDYRLRHGQYKSDHGSRLMHASHPLIPTWDDHESANNPYMHGAQNHQPDAEGDWSARKEASVNAYYEWMPIREPGKGMKREQLWRHFTFGDLASLTTLETRHTGRDKQIEYGEHLPNIHNAEQRDEFLKNILGNPKRNMISAEMELFFADSMADSATQQRPWKLIGNQIPMARTHMPDIRGKVPGTANLPAEILKELDYYIDVGAQDLPLFLDTWDGYPAARERLYQLAQHQGVSDFLVLTGDSHAFWANQLFDASGRAMGVELGAPGITSPGDFEPYSPEAARKLDQMMADHNREVVWTDCLHRGFVKLMLSRESAQVDFVTVDNVKDRRFKAKILRQMSIARKNGSLTYG